jgi:fatty acid desaturase
MHHISHKGYDKVPGVPKRFTSAVFAKGRRRVIDWLDWIPPEAWHLEHDHAHHYHLGEKDDPDVLDRNTVALRDAGLHPLVIRAIIGLFACAWTLVYYGPRAIAVEQNKRNRVPIDGQSLPKSARMFDPRSKRGRETWRRAVMPNGLIRFVITPLCFLPTGRRRARNVLLNLLIAEAIRNLHLFLVITPSHTASDLQRADEPAKDRKEFLVRQIVGSANYKVGGDVVDFAQGWLNYQIEHHVWPDLTMLQYRAVQPKLAALCETYNVPYIQESVWMRMRKTMRILEGRESMNVGPINVN